MGLGIGFSHFVNDISIFSFPIVTGFFLLLCLSWIIARKQLFQNVLFGILSCLIFLTLGFLNYQTRLPDFRSNHYLQLSTNVGPSAIQLKIIDQLKPDRFNSKYIVEINAIEGKSCHGKALLYVQKRDSIAQLSIDETLLLNSTIESIPEPQNPGQFDYGAYLQTLDVYKQLRISKHDILNRSSGSLTIKGRAENLRNHLISALERTSIGENERAIIQALILGEKKDISRELYKEYAAAGAVHILAVSGLHVGIIFLLLSNLFKPLKRLPHGVIIHGLLVFCCLWGYALLTGLSPSVTRAVTMFSFFAFAAAIRRETNSVNTLFLSFFVLLIINPKWLFHVGFQLSYMAVLSILLLNPVISRIYKPRYYLDKLFWNITTVSLSAQIGIVPLTLYYFHQFPGLFLLSNIILLPFLGIIIGCGIVILLLSLINQLPLWLGETYHYCIYMLNKFIGWVAGQEQFLFEGIRFSEAKVIATYSLLISLLWLLNRFSYKRIMVTLACFSLLASSFIWERFSSSENQFVVFHKSRKSLMGYKQGDALRLFRSDTTTNYQYNYPIKDYYQTEGIRVLSEASLPKVLKYNNQIILVLDSLGVYPKISEKPIVILTSSPKLHLERLIDSLQPKLVVADGSNYTSYVNRWRKTCAQKKLPFHHTGNKGALIIE
ncbi:competence protein ComEC [Ulvibacter antarcticus]|uniref:Competence protein ComEC n=2 Tax=Ulvibacter antarcticus TaxID=442714 RepID=A0A3L9Z7Q9_9FLAO|nr:competence protein ComEC [Ulvibacter antarcticus]